MCMNRLPNRPQNLALIAMSILAIAIFAFAPSAALAQVAPVPGMTARFSVLGNAGVTGSAGLGTTVNGDVGSSPTATVTNFPPSSVLPPFALHLTNDVVVQQAHTDAIAAYNFLAAQGPGTLLGAQLNGAVLTSGIYSFATTADLAAGGTLTLNGPGIFVFQVNSALTANVLSNVVGTADPCNVYWRVGTSATLNGVTFRGIVIADASITVGDGANVTGKVLAGTGPTGIVTMAGGGGNTIGGCAVAPAVVCPAITLNPIVLQDGTVGIAYPTQTITASGGTGPYTFLVTSGALPAGLTLNGATGAISGILTTSGTANFTITATDTATGCTGNRAYAIIVGAAPVIPAGVPTLDFVGLMVLFVLLAGAGLFLMSRF